MTMDSKFKFNLGYHVSLQSKKFLCDSSTDKVSTLRSHRIHRIVITTPYISRFSLALQTMHIMSFTYELWTYERLQTFIPFIYYTGCTVSSFRLDYFPNYSSFKKNISNQTHLVSRGVGQSYSGHKFLLSERTFDISC